ncbi:MAG: class I SAM-dependent methyltransferase [Gammaproteobacteria bacterium]|nr:class I SAM-dependent methyltransferase [Gammaproteobacteria bacterium]
MTATSKTDILDKVYSATSNQELEAGYDEWARHYDEDLQRFGYRIPAVIAGLSGRYVNRDAHPLLDAGCGTGLMGEALYLLGYRSLIGIDMSQGMLDVARTKDIYLELHHMTLGERLDFGDNTFVTTFAVGVITIGHAPAHSFDELIRITRPDGYLLFSIRVDREPESGYFAKLDALENDGKWQQVEMTKPFQSMPLAEPEVLHQVCVYRAL